MVKFLEKRKEEQNAQSDFMISVIIPVHNTKKYISQCIDSVLSQTYEDIEIICIDSSTDGTSKIIKEYVDLDNRVRHIIDANCSYGYKLNIGIQVAEGKYIAIVDSDDYVMPEMLEVLAKEVEINYLDFVKSDFESFYMEDGQEKIAEYKDNMWNSEFYGRIIDFKDYVSLLNQISVSIWTGLYRKEFITKNKIRLHESPAASFQDTGFSVFTHIYADRVKYIRRALYKYRIDNNDSSVKSQRKYKIIADEWRWIERQLKERGVKEQILREIRIKKFASYYWNFYRLGSTAAKLFSYYVYEEIKKEYFEEETIKYCPLFLRNQIKSFYLSEDVYEKYKSDIMQIDMVLNKQDVILFSAGRLGQRVLEYDILIGHNAICEIWDNYATEIIADGKKFPVKKVKKVKDFGNREIIIANKVSVLELKKQLLSLGAKEENIHVMETFLNYTECPSLKVSVIVPIYNAEKYMETCIESLLVQTEHSYEIILIDDGSQDNSYQICKEYEARDSRIRIIHQDNAGVTEARRLGLAYAKGKYICFVDADDWVDMSYIQSMLSDAEIHDADVVIGDIYLSDDKSGTEKKECNRVAAGLYTEERKQSDLYPYMMWYPCQWEYVFGVLQYLPAKLYKRGAIENALGQLDSSIYDGEDVVCTYSLLLDAKTIYIGKYCDYHYRMHDGSECRAKKEWKYLENAQKIYNALTYRFNGDKVLERQLHHFMARYINNGSMDIFGYQYCADYMYKNWRLPDGTPLENKKICIYGAGRIGKACYKEIIDVECIEIVAWFDTYSYGKKYGGINIEPKTELVNYTFDYIIIAMSSIEAFNDVRNYCISIGIDEKKIIGTYDLKYHLLVAEDTM